MVQVIGEMVVRCRPESLAHALVPTYMRISLARFPESTPSDAFNISVQGIVKAVPCSDPLLAEQAVRAIATYGSSLAAMAEHMREMLTVGAAADVSPT